MPTDTHPEISQEAARQMLAALKETEAANDAVCRHRSTAAYLMMISDGQSDDLIRLDAARAAARAAIAAATRGGES